MLLLGHASDQHKIKNIITIIFLSKPLYSRQKCISFFLYVNKLAEIIKELPW